MRCRGSWSRSTGALEHHQRNIGSDPDSDPPGSWLGIASWLKADNLPITNGAPLNPKDIALNIGPAHHRPRHLGHHVGAITDQQKGPEFLCLLCPPCRRQPHSASPHSPSASMRSAVLHLALLLQEGGTHNSHVSIGPTVYLRSRGYSEFTVISLVHHIAHL